MRRTIPRSPPDMQTSLWAFCVSWKAVAWTTPLGSLSTLAPHQPQSFADLQIGGGMQVVAAHQFAHVVAVEAARDGIQGVAAADGVVPADSCFDLRGGGSAAATCAGGVGSCAACNWSASATHFPLVHERWYAACRNLGRLRRVPCG